MENETQIDVIVEGAPSAGGAALPTGLRPLKILTMDTADLTHEIKKQVEKIADLFSKIELDESNCVMDEMSFTIQVDASGKVQFVGGVGARAQTGITIKLKRKS